MTTSKPPSRVRFGEFEADLKSGELFYKGARRNLQDQPSRALMFLLEHAGDLVTREELVHHVWPAQPFIDTEHGLNKIVAKLRAALNDDTARPAYIETVPQRGYRFIALVEESTQLDRLPAPPNPVINSIAVLPLENLSGDLAEEYFSDGMTEELISALATVASLRVISRTSVMAYKGVRKPLPAIARELGVDAVVEGSVARSGSKIRVIAQLIYAPEDRHLWSGRYERDLSDVLWLQSEVAASIANGIHRRLSPALERAVRPRQVHPSAYEAYLKGNFFRHKLSPQDLEKSIGFLNHAIELAPSYAPAYGALARCYQFIGIFGLRHPFEVFRQVRVNAVKALELDQTLASAHIALASVNIFDRWDWAGAIKESRQAVEMGPGDSFTHGHLADYLSISGRHEDAIAEMRRALELDPISSELRNWLALLYYRARRYDESLAQCQRVLEVDPLHSNVQWFRALSLEQTGRISEAISGLEQAVQNSGGPHHRAQLGRLYGKAGDTNGALAVREELQAFSRRAYLSPLDQAMVDLGLGDLESMFESLEESFRQGVWRTAELMMPIFDGVRGDQRWSSLIRRIRLEDGEAQLRLA